MTNESGDVGPDGLSIKYKREEDIILQVLSVMAAIGSKTVLSFFDNAHIKQYLQELNPKHRPPHRIERISDGAHLEFSKILEECRSNLIERFVSANSDFWTYSQDRKSVV